MTGGTWRCRAGTCGWTGDFRTDALAHERLAHENAAVCLPDDPELDAYRAGTLDAYLAKKAEAERLAGIEDAANLLAEKLAEAPAAVVEAVLSERVDPQARAGSTPFQDAVCPAGPSRERMDGPAALTFARLRVVNVERCARWHPGFPDDGKWTGADWSNAAAGEMGEACNVVKKLRRQETGGRGAVDPEYAVLLDKLADEIADTVTYLDLLAAFYGIDMAAAVIEKFNRVSVREGLPERLAVDLLKRCEASLAAARATLSGTPDA